MNVLAVIMARAGSVGLKNKHLAPLLGRPVISYTFEHARAAKRLTRVVVSSDCPKVLELAAAEGFETIRRPPELASSEAAVQEVMLHAMDTVEGAPPAPPFVTPFKCDALVVLYGNVPVRGDGVIDQAVEMLEQTGCESVRSFCPVGKWHPAWMARLNGDRVEPLRRGSIHRRQDLEAGGRLLLHDGAVVAVSRKSMLWARSCPDDPHAFFGIDRRGFETRQWETVEIDGPRDLFMAEAVLRERDQGGETARTPHIHLARDIEPKKPLRRAS
jgi:CMP-N,N'-diacetyllegionaminic acid synthase